MSRIEKTILKNLIYNEEYTRKVIPFIKSDYFTESSENVLFQKIENFVDTYKTLPTHEALVIDITDSKNLTEKQVSSSIELLKELNSNKEEKSEIQWLTDQTEKFCQDKAIYNAIMESVQILDDNTNKKSKGEIPELLADALGVSFDSHVGHDYLNDSDARYDFYHRKEKKIRFDLDFFNKITKGGIPIKTLNIALAGCVHPETKVRIRFRKKV